MKRCNEQVLFSTAVEVAWGDESTIHHCELVEFEEYSQILKEWNKREAWKVDGKYIGSKSVTIINRIQNVVEALGVTIDP